MYKCEAVLYNCFVARELSISEVRERLLSLVDDLPRDGVLITRHGKPVARLVPVRMGKADLIGSVPGLIVDRKDDLFSTGERWDAES
jgi:prevent-host-death family protein